MTKDQGQQTKDEGQGTNDFVDVERLCAESFVRHAEFFDTLDSTNDRAGKLARQPELPTPALVATRLQTAGRGRGTNTWWANEGALTFSLVLNPPQQGITTRDWPKLSLTTAVAVCDTLEDELSLIPQSAIRNPHSLLGIKWPNDVLIDGRKACGILIESPGGPAPARDRLIVGVGINVNNSWQSAPREAGTSGTALCDVSGCRHDLRDLLVALLQKFERRLAQLAKNDPEVPRCWEKLSWLTSHDVEAEVNGQTSEGRCVGISDDGALLMQSAAAIQRIYSGSVRKVSSPSQGKGRLWQ